MTRSALFVIDIQHLLAGDANTRVPHAERVCAAGDKILSVSREIIDSYRNKGELSPSIIIFVQHEETSEDGELLRGTDPWKLVFNPRDGIKEEILVSKTTRDTFESNPDLADKLKAEGISEVVTFGLQSEYCVRSTSKGALDAGFKVTILKRAHSTYNTEPKSATEIESDVERELEQNGAKVLPWEDAVATWEQRRMISSYPIFSEL